MSPARQYYEGDAMGDDIKIVKPEDKTTTFIQRKKGEKVLPKPPKRKNIHRCKKARRAGSA